MSGLRATLFGTPAIYWNDQKLSFPFTKMEAMLYYLLVVGETTREKLATLFWGEMDDYDAKKNLRNTIYLIKKMISSEVLIAPTRTTIAINPQLIDSSDLDLLNTVEIDSFLEKCPGFFLDGFYCKNAEEFDEWVVLAREQFQEKITTRLTKSIIKLINDKNYTAAKQSIKQLIKFDEYNESAYRLLMKIHEREEAFYKVMEIYHDLESKLAEELNLQPSSKTQEIYRRVRDKRISKTTVAEGLKQECFFWQKYRIAGFAPGDGQLFFPPATAIPDPGAG